MEEYTAYGLGIISDFAFDALPLSEENQNKVQLYIKRVDSIKLPTDVKIRYGKAQNKNVYVVAEGRVLRVGIGSFIWFDLFLETNTIYCKALHILPDALFQYWFLQQIVPLFLLWKGSAEFLHGMGVGVASNGIGGAPTPMGTPCIGFLGDSFAGKSTLLSYFVARGHSLVCDEHLVISRRTYQDVIPATPFYRPYRASEDLGVASPSFSSAPRPLKHLFLLEPTLGYADIEVQSLSGLAAVSALLPHVQYNLHNKDLPELFPLVEERFKGLAQLVRQVPVKRIYVPRDLDRLSEVYDVLQQELAS